MSTKMKGLLKGLRYISQIFDEEKESDMQIGNPTDVKHVAHIGFDGPAVQESPSWMKEFDSTSTGFSAPLGLPGDNKDDDPDVKWVSEDSKRVQQKPKNSQGKDEADAPKSSRRQSSTDSNPNDQSPKKKDPSKARQARRKEGKDSSEGGVRPSGQHAQESGGVGPDVPRRPRRKKSKELVNEGGSRRSRNRATTSNGSDQTDPDPRTLISNVDDEVRESRVTFKE